MVRWITLVVLFAAFVVVGMWKLPTMGWAVFAAAVVTAVAVPGMLLSRASTVAELSRARRVRILLIVGLIASLFSIARFVEHGWSQSYAMRIAIENVVYFLPAFFVSRSTDAAN